MVLTKAIVILIGNNGTILAYCNGKDIEHKFITSINDETKPELISFFKKHNSQKIYILLDTIDQTYKKKTYPSVRKTDLEKIIRRDLAGDGDKEALKSYIILKTTKNRQKLALNFGANTTGKIDCLFISSSRSELINNWLSFIYELPNRLIGIYMLPIESYNFFKNLNIIKTNKKDQELQDDNIYCIIIQTNVGGFRQIVFSNGNIVFTRLVNYKLEEDNFAEKYMQDLYSTFEYLKRMFTDLSIDKFRIINIFPEDAFAKISLLQNKEIQQQNYPPQIAKDIIGAKNIKMNDDNQHFDLLMIASFLKEKSIHKFATQKIKELETAYLQFKSVFIANIVMLFLLIFGLLFLFVSNTNIIKEIELAEEKKINLSRTLSSVRKEAISGASIDSEEQEITIERIGDVGRVQEVLGNLTPNFAQTYANLGFIVDNAEINSFKYSIGDFKSKSPSKGSKREMLFNGKIFNRSGTIDDLFIEFDTFIKKLKANIGDLDVKYTEINRNIDFNAKFYEEPIEFTLVEKDQKTTETKTENTDENR
jgi:hypothetical protein